MREERPVPLVRPINSALAFSDALGKQMKGQSI